VLPLSTLDQRRGRAGTRPVCARTCESSSKICKPVRSVPVFGDTASAVVELRDGEAVTIDSGHVVAYADTVACKARKMARSWIRSAKSGGNLVFDFTGPGRVLTRTRNPSALSVWVRSGLPRAESRRRAGRL
jgi:hypothetical protein